MGLKAAINYKGAQLPEGYFGIAHVAGGSRAGVWTGNVQLAATEERAKPPQIKTGERRKVVDDRFVSDGKGGFVMEPTFEQGPSELLDSFNVSCKFVDGEWPYEGLYRQLKEDLKKRFGEDVSFTDLK